jgi:hypothetical protein
MPTPGIVVCPHCRDRIGRYEPVVAVDPEGIRITSLAREPHIAAASFELLHRHCFVGRAPTPNIRLIP